MHRRGARAQRMAGQGGGTDRQVRQRDGPVQRETRPARRSQPKSAAGQGVLRCLNDLV